jgi:uracil-DNA glycosylase family 4
MLQMSSEEARAAPMGPGDFDLVYEEGLPPLGAAIESRWQSDPKFYSEDMDDESLLFNLEIYSRWCMCQPFNLELLPAGKYSAVRVKWVPGHIIGDKSGYGPRHSDIMVVGNVPSEKEIGNGRLWIGPAANLTKTEFKRYGLSLKGCYGTYVNKFNYPYPNMKTMPAAWVKEGAYFLQQEIRIVQPKYILLMGADALKSVFGRSAKVKTYRGMVSDFCGAKVMVTNNPSDLVRNPEKMDTFRQDLEKFSAVVRGSASKPQDVNYHVIRNEEQMKGMVEECLKYKMFAMDCEWNGDDHIDGHLLTVQVSCKSGEAYVVVLRSDVGGTQFSPSKSTAVRMLGQILKRPGVGVAGHNFRADLKFLREIGLDISDQLAHNGFDTMLAHHLLMESAEHNLTACALADTDMGRYDHEVDEYLNKGIMHWDMPESVLHPYAAGDADATFRLYEVYRKQLWDDHVEMCEERSLDPKEEEKYGPECSRECGTPWTPSRWNLFKHVVMPVNKAINEMEMTGIVTDPKRVHDMAKAFAMKRDQILEELRIMIHEPEFNPRSSLQVARLLFGKPGGECKDGVVHTQLGYTPIKTTGKRSKMWDACIADEEVYYIEDPEFEERDGVEVMVREAGWNSDFHAPSTDAESLAVLAEDFESVEADMLRSYRFIDQICKNFLVLPEVVEGDEVFKSGLGGCIKRDGRIHTTFSQLTETGRYRSAKPNLQNIPKAREGDLAKLFSKEEKLPPIRTCLMSPPGHVLIEADFESAELFTLGWIARDDNMKRDLELRDAKGEKISLHTTQAINIFKLDMTPQEFDLARKGDSAEAKRLGGLRIAAKSVNFGIPYQRGAAAIARQVQREGVQCTTQEAQQWIDNFYGNYKQVGEFIQMCKDSVTNPQYLTTPYGRRRHFHQSTDDAAMAAQQREACNFP